VIRIVRRRETTVSTTVTLLAEAGQRLPGYEARLGGAFEFTDELESKLSELAELEVALVATTATTDEEDQGQKAAA
jgi:hypothetical protein